MHWSRPKHRLGAVQTVSWKIAVFTATSMLCGLSARADCIDDAASRHQVNAYVLRAIGWHESHLDPAAIGRNRDGSTDLGAFQINSVHLPDLARYGIDAASLADGCTSAYVAAWHYRRQLARFGDTWAAVGAYHSRTPSRSAWYANRIAAILMSWNVMPKGALPFAPADALDPAAAGVHTAAGRSGWALVARAGTRDEGERERAGPATAGGNRDRSMPEALTTETPAVVPPNASAAIDGSAAFGPLARLSPPH